MAHIDSPRPTWAEINLDNLAFNLHSIREFMGERTKIMAVVKANAYGHGSVECAKRLAAEGSDWFGVATLEEAIELRDAEIQTPILCFGGSFPGQERVFIAHDITPVIFDLDRAAMFEKAAAELGRNLDVHVKIDTGMGRVGVPFRDVASWADKLRQFENLHVEGVMTHFAAADDLEDEFTNLQMRRFADAVSAFQEKGFRPTVLDMANSPAAVAHSDSRATMVRVGGILYGLSDDVLPKKAERPELQPVMSLKSGIAFLKKVPAGESIGYGRTFTTERESLIATLPIGYHDGLSRSLSNVGRVIISGKYAPIVGRISMDWTTIDVTAVPEVAVGDTVTLMGAQGDGEIKAEEIAFLTGTISYEVTCGISERVRRFYASNDDGSN
jgi:alanine racemase